MAAETKLQVRRGPSTGTGSWAEANPILAAGEFGYETDTGKFKIGNGSTVWGSLPYASATGAGASSDSDQTILAVQIFS